MGKLGPPSLEPLVYKGETEAKRRKGVACNSADPETDKLPPFSHCDVTQKGDLQAVLKHKSVSCLKTLSCHLQKSVI